VSEYVGERSKPWEVTRQRRARAGEPTFDGVGEAGVPAAELVGEVVVEHTGADLKE
jgi:hypothetical protein